MMRKSSFRYMIEVMDPQNRQNNPSNSGQTPPATPPINDVVRSQPTPVNNVPQPPTAPPAELLQKAAANDRKRSILHAFKTFFSIVAFVATVVIAATLINHFVFQSYYVDGSSMTPTLQNEDRLIIDKVSKTFASFQGKPYTPKRGDIVVLDSSILDRYGHEEQLIKRVIGLPGDTVIIRDGTVTVKNQTSPDGFDIDKELGLQLEATYSDKPIHITVPENNIYVLGDNRGINGSFDSRSFGPTPVSNVQGRLAARIFPFDQARAF